MAQVSLLPGDCLKTCRVHICVHLRLVTAYPWPESGQSPESHQASVDTLMDTTSPKSPPGSPHLSRGAALMAQVSHRVEYFAEMLGFGETYCTPGSYQSLWNYMSHRLVQIGRIDGPTE